MAEGLQLMMLTEILDRAESLAGDTEIRALLRWRERGGKAVGCVPAYVPTEIVDAAGALPAYLFGGSPGFDVVQGDALFQSAICHLPRSILEQGLNGSLQGLDLLVVPSTCDVMRNLSGMWRVLWPAQPCVFLDLPQRYDADGLEFYRHELRRLADEVASATRSAVTTESLRKSIARHNERRRLLRALESLRTAEPWRVPLSELYLVIKAGGLLAPAEHVEMLRGYLGAVRAAARPPLDVARVLLTGGFCEAPPLGFIRTLERAGCAVVADDLLQGLRWMSNDVPEDEEPYLALAGAYLRYSALAPCRYEGDERRPDVLMRAVEDRKAQGVVFASPSFCDPSLLDRPGLLDALEKAGVPSVQLQYAENSVDFGSVREQAGTFADALRLWEAE